MTQPEATTDVTSEAVVPPVVPTTDAPAAATTPTFDRGRRGGNNDANRRNERRPRRGARPERTKPEFDQKIISIRRVTRVMGGGRRFSFSVAMVIGDKRGKVGVGIGKALREEIFLALRSNCLFDVCPDRCTGANELFHSTHSL